MISLFNSPGAGGSQLFTIQDIDRCLYGKQELRVVNVDSKPSPIGGNGGGPGGGGGVPGGSVGEDKNKPAKCKSWLFSFGWCQL